MALQRSEVIGDRSCRTASGASDAPHLMRAMFPSHCLKAVPSPVLLGTQAASVHAQRSEKDRPLWPPNRNSNVVDTQISDVLRKHKGTIMYCFERVSMSSSFGLLSRTERPASRPTPAKWSDPSRGEARSCEPRCLAKAALDPFLLNIAKKAASVPLSTETSGCRRHLIISDALKRYGVPT